MSVEASDCRHWRTESIDKELDEVRRLNGVSDGTNNRRVVGRGNDVQAAQELDNCESSDQLSQTDEYDKVRMWDSQTGRYRDYMIVGRYDRLEVEYGVGIAEQFSVSIEELFVLLFIWYAEWVLFSMVLVGKYLIVDLMGRGDCGIAVSPLDIEQVQAREVNYDESGG